MNTKTLKLLLNHFDFTENELSNLLYQTNSFIAGSAPLNVLVKNNQELKLYDNIDLDIFLRIPYTKENLYPYQPFKNNYYPYEQLAKEKIINCLKSKGYNYIESKYKGYLCYNNPTEEIEYMKSAMSNYIKNIISYQKDKKKIQIITLFDCDMDEFLKTFDLNICQLALISDGDGTLNLYHQHLSKIELNEIKNKKMYITNPLYPANLEKRIHKYLKRGFTWIHSITKEELPTDPLNINCYLTSAFNYDDVISYEEYQNILNNQMLNLTIENNKEKYYEENFVENN
jgi:hypothetical protein